ncbi:MAG: PAS domain S-box protein [Proteobacteria bacterium]|nr:PAS domain S-box protein [Pseudomonadota bacterium]
MNKQQEYKKTILLVEDEALIAVIERETLKRHGFNVILAYSGEKAIEAAQTAADINLILMDINLGKGKMDGTEAAEAILKERDIPILFLSNYTLPEVVEKTEKITSYGYVVKDSGETVLLASIKMAFKLHEVLNKLQEQKHKIETANEELHAALTQIEMSNLMLTASYAEILEGKELFRTTLYSIGDAVITANTHGIVRHMNPVAEALTGWTEGEAREKNIDEIFHIINEEKRDIVENPVKRVLREGTVVGLANHTLLISKDGNEIPIADSGSPIKDAAGKIFGVVLVFSDQTKERAADKKIQASEKLFKNLYQESSIPTFTWQKKDEDFILVDFNRAADHISNGKARGFLGNSAACMYENRPEILSKMSLCFKEHRTLMHEAVSMNFAPGRFLSINYSFIPPDMIIVHFQDQTDRKQAEEKLKESEEKYRAYMDNASDAILISDSEGGFLEANKKAEALLGYTKEELTGMDINRIHPKEELARVMDVFKGIMEARLICCNDTRVLRKDGSFVPVDISGSAIDYLGKKVALGIFIDITERKQAEEKLRASERRFADIINFLPDATLAIDNKGRVIAWNKAIEEMTGVPAEEMLGKGDYEYAIPFYGNRRPILINFVFTWNQDLEKQYDFIKKEGDTITTETSVPFVRGQNRVLWAKAGPLYDTLGNVIGAIESIRDITERKQVEEKLKRQTDAMEASMDGMAITDKDQKFVYMNEYHARIYGYDTAQELIGKSWHVFYDEDEMHRFRQNIIPDFIREGHWQGEITGKKKDGSVFHQELSLTAIENGGLICVVHDITKRKHAEEAIREAEEKYRNIFENIIVGLYQVSPEGRFITANPAAARILGYESPEELISTITDIGSQIYVCPEDRAGALELLRKDGFFKNFEVQNRQKDGNIIWVMANIHVVRDDQGKVLYYEGTIRDITDRKLAEDKIKTLLSQKELILREVHHRIKNNMNVIMSLFSLQSSTLKDPAVISSLEDARSRVQSMMILYDKLYRSTDFRAISAKEYLTSLVDEIVMNFPNRISITVEKQIDDHILSAKILSPIGIILNELLTNAMKHAFIERENGILGISLLIKDNHATIIVQDNGTGIPESIDIATSTGFGLQLVDILTEQLEGTVRIEREKGTRFVLEFEI